MLVFIFGVPKIKKINSIAEDISQKIIEAKSLEIARIQSKELQEERKEYNDDFENNSAKKMFLDTADYKNFINSMYDLAEKNNLECKINYTRDSFSKDKKAQEKDNQNPYIVINLDVIGDYNNSYRFLNKIENYPFLIDILEFKISKNKDEKVLSNFSIKIYATP